MRKFLIVLLSFFLLGQANAQYKPQKKSTGPGTLFFYWGYNRSIYSPSTIRFIGPGYDFRLAGVQAVDRPSRDFSEYIDPKMFTVPQFDVRIGYNIKVCRSRKSID